MLPAGSGPGAGAAARGLAVAGLLCAGACVRQLPLALPELEGGRALVVVAIQEDVVSAIAVSLEEGAVVPVELDTSRSPRLYALMYRESLDALRLPSGALPLETTGCGRALPLPSRISELDLGEGETWAALPEVPARVGSLRFALSGGACGELGAGLSVDVRCAKALCEPEVEQSSCNLTLEASSCGFPALLGQVGGLGELCLRDNDALGRCTEQPAVAPAVRSISCAGGSEPCVLDLYAPVDRPLFEVRRWASPDVAVELSLESFERPPGGFFADLVVLDEQVAVSSSRGVSVFWQCSSEEPWELIFLDPEAVEQSRTASAPPCLTQLVRDPYGDGFLGAFGGLSPRIGRFSADGRLLASIAPEGPVDRRAASSIAIGGSPPRTVAVTLTGVDPDHELLSLMFLVDLETWTERRVRDPLGRNVRELTRLEDGNFAAVDDTLNGILYIDAETGVSAEGPNLLGTLVAAISDVGLPLFLPRPPGPPLTLLSVTKAGGGIFAFDADGQPIARAGSYERLSESWAMLPWPADPRLVLVGLHELDRTSNRASVALFDPTHHRFLPGLQDVGRGAVGRLRPDARGRVWATLPWTAEVVRLSARGEGP